MKSKGEPINTRINLETTSSSPCRRCGREACDPQSIPALLRELLQIIRNWYEAAHEINIVCVISGRARALQSQQHCVQFRSPNSKNISGESLNVLYESARLHHNCADTKYETAMKPVWNQVWNHHATKYNMPKLCFVVLPILVTHHMQFHKIHKNTRS